MSKEGLGDQATGHRVEFLPGAPEHDAKSSETAAEGAVVTQESQRLQERGTSAEERCGQW